MYIYIFIIIYILLYFIFGRLHYKLSNNVVKSIVWRKYSDIKNKKK